MLDDNDPAKRALLDEMETLFDAMTGPESGIDPMQVVKDGLSALYEDRYQGAPLACELTDADWGDAFLRQLERHTDPKAMAFKRGEWIIRRAQASGEITHDEQEVLLKGLEEGLQTASGRKYKGPKERRVFVVTLESDAPVDMITRAVRGNLEGIDEVGELGDSDYRVENVEVTPPV